MDRLNVVLFAYRAHRVIQEHPCVPQILVVFSYHLMIVFTFNPQSLALPDHR